MADLQALAAAPPSELAAREPDEERLRSSGLFAALLMPKVAPLFLRVHANDARLELAALAPRFARHRLREGDWPASLEELAPEERAGLPADLALERDGEALVLVRAAFPSPDGEPPRLRLGR